MIYVCLFHVKLSQFFLQHPGVSCGNHEANTCADCPQVVSTAHSGVNSIYSVNCLQSVNNVNSLNSVNSVNSVNSGISMKRVHSLNTVHSVNTVNICIVFKV